MLPAARSAPAWMLGLGFALGLGLAATASAGPSVYPTGVTRYDPAAAYNCDVLFGAFNPPNGKTYLIDMDGHVLHQWDKSGYPTRMLDPARMQGAKGTIGVQLQDVPAGNGAGQIGLVPGVAGITRDLTVGFIDWSGNVTWQWGNQAPGGAALQHHDWDLLPNGDVLLLANKVGRLSGFGNRLMLDDVIYEVTRDGRIVWTWKASQHLAEFGFTAAQLKLLQRVSAQDYLHMNDMQVLGSNHWEHSGDQRFAADNILISSRNANFIAIISRSSGKIVWRIGPNFTPWPQPYAAAGVNKLPFKVDRLSGQHDANMIGEGLPGAGNILVFDNEGEGGYPPATMPLINGSRVLEINPVTDEVVWQYTGRKDAFYSPFISSAQRLPNGNTLIDEGIDGRFFQVTRQGRIVWEYVSPYALAGGPGAAPQAPFRLVYRIQAVPYGWVPIDAAHSERAVVPPGPADFHITATGN
ncbi:MAG: aryl-sulfate sulfotransferase [Steroidobacteraceae bacterium]